MIRNKNKDVGNGRDPSSEHDENGRATDPITVEVRSTTQDADRQPVEFWRGVVTARALVEQLRGRVRIPMLEMKSLSLGEILFALFLVVSISSPSAADTIKVGGTGGALGAIRVLADSFKKQHPETEVMVLLGLSSGGARKAVPEGAVDIGVTSRAGKTPERVAGTVARQLGKAALVFATSNKNPSSNITTQELIEIYTGKKNTWSNGERLRLILRPESDSDTETIKAISPDMARAVRIALSRAGMVVAVTDQETADAIEQTPGAIGTASLPLIVVERRLMKALSLNGVTASAKHIADGSYPLFKTFYLLTKPEPGASVRRFIDFMASPAGRKVLFSLGFWLDETKVDS